MRCMAYCVLRTPQDQRMDGVVGVGGHPIFLVASNGLSAAVSRTGQLPLPTDVPSVLAYERAVDRLHQERTVIPMRYGCIFDREAQIGRFLAEHRQEYNQLLDELDGCVEMGIRVIREARPPGVFPVRTAESQAPAGVAYLQMRRTHYGAQDQGTGEQEQLAQRIRSAFRGVSVRSKTENPAPRDGMSAGMGAGLLSLYFLVPRKSVEAFRQVFRRRCNEEDGRLLLSGPWPPYNFVLPEAPLLSTESRP